MLAIVYAHPRMLGISHLRSSALRPTLPPKGASINTLPPTRQYQGVILNTSTPQGVAHVCLDCLPTPGKPLYGLPAISLHFPQCSEVSSKLWVLWLNHKT